MSVTVVVNEEYRVVYLDTIESITDIELLFALSSSGHLPVERYPIANARLDDYIFAETNSEQYWEDAEEQVIDFNDLDTSDEDDQQSPCVYCEDPKGVTKFMEMFCVDLATKLDLNIYYNATEAKIVFNSDIEKINENIKSISRGLGFTSYKRFGREIVRSCADSEGNNIYYKCKIDNYYTDAFPIDFEEDDIAWREVEVTIVISITQFLPSLQFISFMQLLNMKSCLSKDQKANMNHIKKLSGCGEFRDVIKYLKTNSEEITVTIY